MTDQQVPASTHARRGYDAYGRHTGYRTFDDRPMPAWALLGDRIQGAWTAAAQRIKESVINELGAVTPSPSSYTADGGRREHLTPAGEDLNFAYDLPRDIVSIYVDHYAVVTLPGEFIEEISGQRVHRVINGRTTDQPDPVDPPAEGEPVSYPLPGPLIDVEPAGYVARPPGPSVPALAEVLYAAQSPHSAPSWDELTAHQRQPFLRATLAVFDAARVAL